MGKVDRKYILGCNSVFDYNRYWTVRFDGDDTCFTDVGAEYNLKDKKIFKNTLAEIDSQTCCLTEPLFVQHVLKRGPVFISRVGEIKIFYKSKGDLHTIKPVFNNPLLTSKLHLVQGNNIYDKQEFKNTLSLIKDSHVDFVSYISEQKDLGNTALSGTTIGVLRELRHYVMMLRNYSSSAVINEIDELEKVAEEKLTSYKEYREMLILKQKFSSSSGGSVEKPTPSEPISSQVTFFPLTWEERNPVKNKKR